MKTPAKINLFLRVVRRRPDGYHELETLFCPLRTPADTVCLKRTNKPGIELLTDDPTLPSDGRNLCVKALSAFCEAAHVDSNGWEITLKKQIPVTAGMGGGSSDAAAVLLSANKNTAKHISDKRLAEIAKKIGADVPFFLHPVPTLATGIGEKRLQIHGIPAKLPILLVAPQFPISAKWAYTHLQFDDLSKQTQIHELIRALRKRDLTAAAQFLRNDLERAAMKKFPILTMIANELTASGAIRSIMTGSGPTMVGWFSDFSERDSAFRKLAKKKLPFRLILPE